MIWVLMYLLCFQPKGRGGGGGRDRGGGGGRDRGGGGGRDWVVEVGVMVEEGESWMVVKEGVEVGMVVEQGVEEGGIATFIGRDLYCKVGGLYVTEDEIWWVEQNMVWGGGIW